MFFVLKNKENREKMFGFIFYFCFENTNAMNIKNTKFRYLEQFSNNTKLVFFEFSKKKKKKRTKEALMTCFLKLFLRII